MFAIYDGKPYLRVKNGFMTVGITEAGYKPGVQVEVPASGAYLHFEILAKLGTGSSLAEEPKKAKTPKK